MTRSAMYRIVKFSHFFDFVALMLIGLTILSGLILAGSGAYAQIDSNVSIEVPVSCSLTPTIDSPHSAIVNNNTYQADIGSTTLAAFCNDSNGFSIYAIGYSNEEYGNTKLLATVAGVLTPASDIVTGTATSGDTSNWAMKLTANTSGTYVPTIHNSFSAYHVVPSTFTKVASFASATTPTVGAELDATYAVFIKREQPAGNYHGKVKFTLVHPSDADAPVMPVSCPSGYICYSPRAQGVTNSMGNQSISNSDTEAILRASNFKRSGHGFAGWTDKFDWVVGENDADGNGTGNNAGYHIYGPNQTIEFTAGQYSGSNPGLSLYAVWVKGSGNMQDWTGCANLGVGQVVALTDNRSTAESSYKKDVYAISKLADGNCWMMENLRLRGYGTSVDNSVTLSTANTNNPLNDGTDVTLVNVDSTGATSLITSNYLSVSINPTQTAWCTANTSDCVDKSMIYTGNTSDSVSNMTTPNANVYSYGNHYNWYSATAGNGVYSFNQNNDSVDGDICPHGWRLPQGGDKTRITSNDDNDFWNLIVDGLNNDTNPANYDSNTYPYYNGSAEAGPIDKKIRSFPNNFIYSGYASGSSVTNRGSSGLYWSSTAGDSSLVAYRLAFGSTYVGPGSVYNNKYLGSSVRCVAGL